MQPRADSPTGSPGEVLARASEQIEWDRETSWDAPSRFGLPGRAARALLRRVLRPYEVRRREVDAALVAVLSAQEKQSRERSNRLRLAGRLDGDAVVEKETSIGGLWLQKDAVIVTPSILEEGVWAPNIGQFMTNVLRPGMTFVDVGANIGYLSLLGSQLVGPQGRVFAVEPEPFNVDLLKANLWRNGCRNVEVLELAAWTFDGHLSLTPNPEGGAGAAVDNNALKPVMLPCARLDGLITGPVDLMKVDCEQTDVMAVQGASALFDANPGMTIIVEYFPHDPSHVGLSAPQILQTYLDLGFAVFLMDGDGEVQPTTREHLLSIGASGMPLDLVLRRSP